MDSTQRIITLLRAGFDRETIAAMIDSDMATVADIARGVEPASPLDTGGTGGGAGDWTVLPLVNGWGSFHDQTVMYRVESEKTLRFRGLLDGTANTDTKFAELPEEIEAPDETRPFGVHTGLPYGSHECGLDPDGLRCHATATIIFLDVAVGLD